MYLNGLLCFLNASTEHDLSKFFTVSHQHEAADSVWDVDKGGMVTEHDRDLQLDDADNAYVITNIALVEATTNSQQQETIPRREEGSYQDSQVSTVRS